MSEQAERRAQSTYRIATSGGWLRFVVSENVHADMWRIGCAEITAATTARPAYREMIDTMRWGEIL